LLGRQVRNRKAVFKFLLQRELSFIIRIRQKIHQTSPYLFLIEKFLALFPPLTPRNLALLLHPFPLALRHMASRQVQQLGVG
jgi:hypothetical protein